MASEKKDLDKMIAEVEQHAATLKEETAVVEESNRNRTHDELLMEEKREQLEAKERDLQSFEADLKNKAKSLEEHGQTIFKLETQVKERLQRAADLETKSSELEKGMEGWLHLPTVTILYKCYSLFEGINSCFPRLNKGNISQNTVSRTQHCYGSE